MAEKKGNIALAILAKSHPQTSPPADEEAQGDDMGLDAASGDLITAVKSGDVAGVSEALKNAFSILDSQPHEEGPHEEEGGPA